ncbi:MAG TPA: hypothetical protein VKR79_02820 [Gaiellaceae bacterium]|nr:hypothetical protein [Gaiellaceae bacterium]
MARIVLALALVLLALAACGGSPRQGSPGLPRSLAQTWATQADAIAAAAQTGDGCHARQLANALGQQVAANIDRIPARFRTPLLGAVATLAGRITCTPTPPHPKPTGPKKGPKPPKHGPGPPGHGGDKPQGDGG